MGKIYKGQSKLRIVLDTRVNLSGCTCRINYRKPSKQTGNWSAFILGTQVYYDLTAITDLDEAGPWQFWAHVTWVDNLVAEGEPVTVRVNMPGT